MEKEEKTAKTSAKQKFNYLFIFFVILLLLLPLFTTFNEFLSEIVLKSGFWQRIQNAWVPYLARFVGGLLAIFGVENESHGSVLFLRQGNTLSPLFLSWNCIGWQSLILIILTLITGLQGAYSFASKVETIIIGLLGTFVMNVFRIAVIALLFYYWSPGSAVFFHNYGGTALTIAWIIFFWWFVFSFVLKPEEKKSAKGARPPRLRRAKSGAACPPVPRHGRRGSASGGKLPKSEA